MVKIIMTKTVLKIDKLEHSNLFRISPACRQGRDFVLRIFIGFIFCILLLISQSYALNLNTLKLHFLKGDYAAAIKEGEKILAGVSNSQGVDELYYILGLSYFKEGNYLRAADIFEIILNEFKASCFKEEAMLGLGDTFFIRKDFAKAKEYYQGLLLAYPKTKFRELIFSRLSQINFDEGKTEEAKKYLEKLNDTSDIYYTVQIGSFSRAANAYNLKERLLKKEYPAYVEELSADGEKKTYRVRVGKFKARQEAVQMQDRLSQEGFPTKIYP